MFARSFKSGTCCQLKKIAKIRDGLSVPDNRDMLLQLLVGMLCHRVASYKGRIVQGADLPRPQCYTKNRDVMSRRRIVQGRVVFLPLLLRRMLKTVSTVQYTKMTIRAFYN
jgi:hypothetical protein